MAQTQFNHTRHLCSLNEDVVQPKNRFCIDVQTSHKVREVDRLRTQYNNNRPSVIYFHGSLTKAHKVSENVAGTSDKIILGDHCSHLPETTNFEDDNKSEYCSDDKEVEVLEDLSPEKPSEESENCRCRKRHRTSYNAVQLRRLEEEFHGDNYIIGMKRWRLSEELSIPEKQIKIWFQNRRTKSKKDCSPSLKD